MIARGSMTVPCALITLAVLLLATSRASAWEQQYRYPVKVKVSGFGSSDSRVAGIGSRFPHADADWDVAAGQPRREILCPRRGYSVALGMRPFFASLIGSSKVLSKGAEGGWLNFQGQLRIPSDKTQWEFYANLDMWDKIGLRLEYLPWSWGGSGHIPTDGNFGGLLLKKDDGINSDLNITSFLIGADYEVAFGRDLIFGPNADLYVTKWSQSVTKDTGEGLDFSQTILQPAIGAHVRYEPTNTGYFSWFKPAIEGRFSWMSFNGLGLSTWDLGAGIAPPVSRNVDAGIKVGYKQWKLDGSRGRLFADVDVEGLYLDLSLQF